MGKKRISEVFWASEGRWGVGRTGYCLPLGLTQGWSPTLLERDAMGRGSEMPGTSRTALASKGQVPPRLRKDAHSLHLCRTHSSSAALRTQPGARDTSRSCSFWSAREQHPEERPKGEGEASLQVTWGQQLLLKKSVLSFFFKKFHLFIYGCSGSLLLHVDFL